jgi:hypothetical protein
MLAGLLGVLLTVRRQKAVVLARCSTALTTQVDHARLG